MPTPDYLRALHSQYRALAATEARHLTADQTRSLTYFHLDVALRGQPWAARQARDRVTAWIGRAHAVDRFIEEHHRVPRRNSRRPDHSSADGEFQLAVWLEDQRRPTARARQSAYQRLRLDAYPGLDTRSRDERWRDALDSYADFLKTNGRAPSARSADRLEASLALWATAQRRAHRHGRISAERTAALSALRIWTWG